MGKIKIMAEKNQLRKTEIGRLRIGKRERDWLRKRKNNKIKDGHWEKKKEWSIKCIEEEKGLKEV